MAEGSQEEGLSICLSILRYVDVVVLCQGIYTCKAKSPKYKTVKSNHPGSENIRLSGPFIYLAVATIGH